ncbi:MAG: type I-MYXAN CRISPR-associated Cas8a1/Cmx1 [Cyanobacteria bacterium J06633_8]
MSRINSPVKPKINLDLSDPSITPLHRAGMAGLWMTLNQLEKIYPIPAERVGHLSWSLTAHSISISWEGEDFAALDWLFKESFQISEEGLISFTGLNPETMNFETRLSMHLGIKNTFLQHNKFFKSSGSESKDFIIDGKRINIKYKKAKYYKHQNFAKDLCNKNGELFNNTIGIRGWLYPGAVIRHYTFPSQTNFEESIVLAIALAFAPVACRYLFVRSQMQIEAIKYALVIPEVINLELFAQCYSNSNRLSYHDFFVSSLGEAGLKCISYIASKITNKYFYKKCEVISFSEVDWSSFQNTRNEIISVSVNKEAIYYYKLSCIYFPEYRVIYEEKSKKYIIVGDFIRGIIANNLIDSLPWWTNFITRLTQDDLLKHIFFQYQGFYKMIQKTDLNIESQQIFIKACHEALKIRYAKIYERKKDDEYAQIERENIRIASQLRRCTNSENFRKFISEFWGKTGQLSTLQEHWELLLPIISGQSGWKLARDLTFIALASYPKNKKQENNSLEEPQRNN